MSSDGPPIDLVRGDRLGGFKVCSVLGWGSEGVAADVKDEFINVHRVLKGFPATPFWVNRIRYVTEVFLKLSALDVCPMPIAGGVRATSRGIPVAYLVTDHRIGRPLSELLTRRWSEARAIKTAAKLIDCVARVHRFGWAFGDFEAGNNIVLFNKRPLFIDIGFGSEPFERPSFGEDFDCLADVTRRLAQQSGSLKLLEAAASLAERGDQRLDRRSLTVWKSRSTITA